MPLIRIDSITADVRLALWHLDESAEQLLSIITNANAIAAATKLGNERRRRETLAVYALLQHVTGSDTIAIRHLPSGAPKVDGWNVSISHTKGYVAVIASGTRNVAVDIEYRSNRVDKIAERFLRSDESATTTDERLAFWCAKETTYKYFSDSNLTFEQIRIRRAAPPEDSLVADNLLNGEQISINVVQRADYILAYTMQA